MSVADVVAILASLAAVLSMFLAKRQADRASRYCTEASLHRIETQALLERVKQVRDDIRGMRR